MNDAPAPKHLRIYPLPSHHWKIPSDTQSEEGAAVNSSSSSESNPPCSQSVTATVHVSANASFSRPSHMKDDTAVQIEGEAGLAQLTSAGPSCGIIVHSQTLETQALEACRSVS